MHDEAYPPPPPRAMKCISCGPVPRHQTMADAPALVRDVPPPPRPKEGPRRPVPDPLRRATAVSNGVGPAGGAARSVRRLRRCRGCAPAVPIAPPPTAPHCPGPPRPAGPGTVLLNNSASPALVGGGEGLPPPPLFSSDWAKFLSGPLANQTFSPAPSA